MVPSLREPIRGCAFAPRCGFAIDACRQQQPELARVAGAPTHQAACLRVAEVLAA